MGFLRPADESAGYKTRLRLMTFNYGMRLSLVLRQESKPLRVNEQSFA
jgi:hypothetical protein